MNRTPRPSDLVAVAVTLLSVSMAYAADPRFGDLPPGAVSVSETGGVAAEICRDHLFDPTATTLKLPVGYRLISASEAAVKDFALQTLLQTNPKLRAYTLGSLCFVLAGRLVVDDNPIHSSGQMPLAFWWVFAEGPRHPSMRGKTTWLQLGSWYPSGTASQTAVLKTDPMAEFVDLAVERLEPNAWRLRLVLPTETVTAEVTGSGNRVPSRAAQPGYMSVPMSGRAADYFSVFTYYGHHHQAAQGTWRGSGTGVFSDAFSIPGEAAAFGTVFQDGWSSRAGLYRFSAQ